MPPTDKGKAIVRHLSVTGLECAFGIMQLGQIDRCPTPFILQAHLSHDRRFPTMWYVRPAKAQTSLRICAVWSEPLLVAWIFFERSATDWTSCRVSKLKRRLHRLVWVYTCQNATLLEITCHGSFYMCIDARQLTVTCKQQSCRPACASAQSDQPLCYSHSGNCRYMYSRYNIL